MIFIKGGTQCVPPLMKIRWSDQIRWSDLMKILMMIQWRSMSNVYYTLDIDLHRIIIRPSSHQTLCVLDLSLLTIERHDTKPHGIRKKVFVRRLANTCGLWSEKCLEVPPAEWECFEVPDSRASRLPQRRRGTWSRKMFM